MKKDEKKMNKAQKNPFRNTMEIIILYVVMGVIWVYLSDGALSLFIHDTDVMEQIQTYKGIFYVIMTGILFYIIIKKRMDKYNETIIELKVTVDELGKSYETLSNLENKLYSMAYYDSLTGLFSKNKIVEYFREHINFHANEMLGVLYLDIDDFKDINETRGHDVGDELIQMVADELRLVFPEPNQIGRISGDEFIIYIEGKKTREELETYVGEKFNLIKHTYKLRKDYHYVTFSAGLTIYPSDDRSFIDLFKWSDLALKIAKEKGKNQVVYYSKDFADKAFHQTEIANQLYYGNKNEEFRLHYQPIVCSGELKATMVEALVRWENPYRGFLYPGDFIEIAEKTGHIIEMTYFVIRESFKQQKLWKSQGYDITISINLSSKVLNSGEVINRLKDIIKLYDADPSKCILEITESMVIENFKHAEHLLHELKNLGFKIALDDFGTGYSSMTYLQKLPIDILKIDRSFIRELSKSDQSILMLRFMINLAHSLNMKIISEGVEEKQQLDLLEELKSDYHQGYYFARPSDPDSLDKNIFKC